MKSRIERHALALLDALRARGFTTCEVTLILDCAARVHAQAVPAATLRMQIDAINRAANIGGLDNV